MYTSASDSALTMSVKLDNFEKMPSLAFRRIVLQH